MIDEEHHHSHDHHTSDLILKKERWEAIDRFKSRKGREPTADELFQLLDHGHTHDHLPSPGTYASREKPIASDHRDVKSRAFTVGIGGPVGSGKSALMLELCRALRNKYNVGAVTNDIFTKEDGEFLIANDALSKERICPIETGGCPHAAIREDISANLEGCERLTVTQNCNLILLESGGDNLAANFSRELADFIIYVIDVAGGDKVPRKGGPGITQADVLVINKVDLAPAVGADLKVMARDAALMRGEDGPVVFSIIKNAVQGLDEILLLIEDAYINATDNR